MPLELRWLIVPAVTGLYAASRNGDAPLVESARSRALAGPAQALRSACAAEGIDFERFVDELIFFAVEARATPIGRASMTNVARAALVRAAGDAAASYTQLFAPLVQELAEPAAKPELAAELQLRERPLAEQWEARGPGLLAQLARLTEPQAIVDRATVLPVYPVWGGGGRALPAYNTVMIEAVLANPLAQLPEVVRLAWLLAMLSLDLARYREPLADPDRTVPLALVPPVLEAAGEVELSRCDRDTLELALRSWRLAGPEPLETAATLLAWWQTYQDTRPPWPLALGALERMMA